MNDKPNIKDLGLEGLPQAVKELGEPSYRAGQLCEWLYAKGARSFEDMTNLSKTMRAKLIERYSIGGLEMLDRRIAADGTIKYLFGIKDGDAIETVFIPDRERGTVCISTQAGCKFSCAFCATGKSGFRRNLTAGEILDQLLEVRHEQGAEAVTNIVMMGMGEPLDNMENLDLALEAITNPKGMGFGARRITVSTIGLPDKMLTFGEKWPGINLALSLHAADDTVRAKLVPSAKKVKVHELMKAVKAYPLQKTRKITIEMVLFEGVNDSDADARTLIAVLKGTETKVNLMLWNSVEGAHLKGSSHARAEAFQKILANAGITVTIRRSRGSDIEAACGQLRGFRNE